jgi:hypothetical protein
MAARGQLAGLNFGGAEVDEAPQYGESLFCPSWSENKIDSRGSLMHFQAP